VVDTLQSSSISSSAVVSSLLKNVLGPISEAQGIAKAIVGLAAAIVDMYWGNFVVFSSHFFFNFWKGQ
jgi:hypothetical protein